MMKILYAGPFSHGASSSVLRLEALRRAGHSVETIDIDQFYEKSTLVRRINFRLIVGPSVARLNREILKRAASFQPDVFWGDKVLMLRPSTLDKLRAMGIASVSYMIDNAFGPRKDPGWRLYMKDIPHFDLHCTQREVNVTDYKARGARDVIKVQTAYDQTAHFPPPAGWSDADRNREVSFIGSPYDDRDRILVRLAQGGVPLSVSGARWMWEKKLTPEEMALVYREKELSGDAYREGIWRSKINLSFVTKSNHDEHAHKSFEIAGCGGFLLAERSPGHTERFVEDEEAVFFTSEEELRAKIARYLPDEAARARIAAAGRLRAQRDGYHNDHQVQLIVDRLETIIPQVKAAAR